jgi:hypothetical protein
MTDPSTHGGGEDQLDLTAFHFTSLHSIPLRWIITDYFGLHIIA